MKNVIYEKINNPYIDIDYKDFDKTKLSSALSEALKKIDKGIIDFGDRFPASASKNLVYEPSFDIYMGGWNQGFWTGMLWLAYEESGDETYKNKAMSHIPMFLDKIEKKEGVNHHDMGFLYTPSCVAAYKLTGDEDAKKAALLAAEHLTSRYNSKGKFIQAWGNVGDNCRLIVDCLMNIPLLYWASTVTGDNKYRDLAYNHFRTTLENTVRDNAGSHQTYHFDYETGAPLYGERDQGHTNDSTWSRGQAWCIYGMMLTKKYVDDPDAVDICKKMTNFYINRLPDDMIPYWDFDFTSGDEPRDSSAAAAAVCGIIELVKLLPDSDPDKSIYKKVINKTMNSLYDIYSTKDVPQSNGLLKHATYSKPHNLGVDECNIWGDYYYMEALHKLSKDTELYW